MPRLIMGAPPCLTVLAAVLVVAFTGCGEKVGAAPPAPLGPNPAARASDAEAAMAGTNSYRQSALYLPARAKTA